MPACYDDAAPVYSPDGDSCFQAIGGRAMEGSRDMGGALQALIGASMQRCHLSACLRHLEVALAPGGGLDPEHAQQVIRLNSFQILIAVMGYARDLCSVV